MYLSVSLLIIVFLLLVVSEENLSGAVGEILNGFLDILKSLIVLFLFFAVAIGIVYAPVYIYEAIFL